MSPHLIAIVILEKRMAGKTEIAHKDILGLKEVAVSIVRIIEHTCFGFRGR